MKSTTYLYVLVTCAIVSLAANLVSCAKQKPQAWSRTPLQVTAWPGRPGSLMEWGRGATCVFGVLGRPHSQQTEISVWKWQGGVMHEAMCPVLPWSIRVIPLGDDLCGLSLGREKGPWPFALVTPQDNHIIYEWNALTGWRFRCVGGSMNGKYIGLLEEEGVDAAGYEFGKPRAKVAVIDVTRRELRRDVELNGHGDGTVEGIAVADDGRYIAIVGWDNGTAMVDAKASTLLWSKRPEREVSTHCAAFAPDGNLIYTGGFEGCVYGLDVENGNIISQRWATRTGEPINGRGVSSLAISADGRWLGAGTGPEGDVYVWDVNNDSKAEVLAHGKGPVLVVAFSADSKRIASVGGGVLKVWCLSAR